MTKETYQHKILIVEDEEVMLNAIADNLALAGFKNVFRARNGEDGLALALRENPDLILLDIVMPKMDGMTMLDALRKDDHGKNMKVILLTNLTADDSIMTGVVKNIPSYYIVKTDYSIDDVIRKVKVTLGIVPVTNQ